MPRLRTRIKKRLALLLGWYLSLAIWWPPLELLGWAFNKSREPFLSWWQTALWYLLQIGAIGLGFASWWLLSKIPNEEFEV